MQLNPRSWPVQPGRGDLWRALLFGLALSVEVILLGACWPLVLDRVALSIKLTASPLPDSHVQRPSDVPRPAEGPRLDEATGGTGSPLPSKETVPGPPKRAALMLRTDSFPHVHGGRLLLTDPELQLEATKSQLEKLVLPLEREGFEVYVFSFTTKNHSKMVKEALREFGKRVRFSKLDGGGANLLVSEQARNFAKEKGFNYSLAVGMRHELLLKQDLGRRIAEIYKTKPSSELFLPFKMSKPFKWAATPVADELFVLVGPAAVPSYVNIVGQLPPWPSEECTFLLQGRLGVDFLLKDYTGQSSAARASNPLYDIQGRWQAVPPWHFSPHIAVLLRGESFRIGGPTSRRHGNKGEQMEASESQLQNVVLPLERGGFSVDVFSSTYETNWTQDIADKFKGYLRRETRLKKKVHQADCVYAGVNLTMQYAEERGVTYGAVVILRHDTHIKQGFGEMVIDIFTKGEEPCDKFLLPFKMTKDFRAWGDRVPDTMQVMAGRFLPHFANVLRNGTMWPQEAMFNAMIRIGRSHLGFMLPNFFGDSNSEKGWNPLYRLAARPEASEPLPQERL